MNCLGEIYPSAITNVKLFLIYMFIYLSLFSFIYLIDLLCLLRHLYFCFIYLPIFYLSLLRFLLFFQSRMGYILWRSRYLRTILWGPYSVKTHYSLPVSSPITTICQAERHKTGEPTLC